MAKTFIGVLLILCVAVPAVAQQTITTTGETWLRESVPDTSYDNDGLGVYNSLVPPDQRRITLIEFDLTGVDLTSRTGVKLDLYSIAGWSSKDYPTVTEAYIIDTAGASIAGATWNSYMNNYDAGKVALTSLGAYDYDTITNEPGAYDTFVASVGSAADLALVQAETDNLLTIAIWAKETGYEVRADWEDDAYYGHRGFLTLTSADGGPVTNLSPSNGATGVSLDAVLDWQVNLFDYNDPPDFTVYIDTDSDPNDGTIVNINDENITVYDPNLTQGTTYWWRVDVTDPNSSGNPIIYTGDTWTFTTQSTIQITVETEGWLREYNDSFYEDDGLNIYNSLSSSEDQRRITLLEFDLSSLPPGPYSSVALDLYSMDEWSSADFPVASEAFIVEMNGNPIQDLTWTSYFSIYDSTIDPLDTLGAYDYNTITNEPSAYDTYVTSIGNATDLTKVLAEKTGDNKLTIVIKAVETGYEVRADWEDDVYFGNRAFLTFVPITEKAYAPTPNNEATDINPHTSLTWQPGLDAISHNIYLGTDFDQVNQATDPYTLPGWGNQPFGNEIYTPASTLDYDTTYYWRIDEVNSVETVKGSVWRFTTQSGQARNPIPPDLEENVNANITLLWTAGPAATEQNVYFGTDYNEVLTATDPNAEPVGRGTVPLETENYLPDESPLEYGTTYYWRIDGINGAQEWKGDVWSFSTNACPVADLTGDCKVDSADWNEFAFQWLEDTSSWNWSSWCADQDGDDDVDTVDLSLFSSEWLKEGDPSVGVQIIKPWRRIVLDPDYRGAWFVAGDVDGDGEVEIVTAQGNTSDSSHYVNAVGVKNLDGTTLWNWGTPNSSHNYIAYDIACQIHDWDNDGDNEVIILTSEGGQRYMVELDGATGVENRRFPIPSDSTDCITFCNLSGPAFGHPKDIIVKTRYTQIWAYDYNGNQLWDSGPNPGGYNTSHQTRPMDLNNDGIDELSLGCTMADKDGNILWITKKDGNTIGGHVDCARFFKPASTLNDVRIALTYCGGNRIAMTDGNGSILWDLTGEHYESIDVGKIRADIPGNQIAVDVPYAACGNDPVYVIDENGDKVSTSYHLESRFHRLADWNGDGLQDVIVAEDQAAYDGFGNKIAFFEMPVPDGVYVPSQGCGESRICYVGDMTGDGVTDVVYTTIPGTVVYIYRNALGQKPAGDVRLGTEINFSFY